jgi:hypothetical protein
MNIDEDDDIGVLIYQHAKQETEKAAAAASQKPARPRRQLARVATSTKSKQSTRSSYEASWMLRYNELVVYKRKFKDCCVPKRYKANPSLGNWVQVQRRRFRNKSLAKNCIAKLDKIGFTWEVKDLARDWMTRYKQLVKYKREFGDCCVPKPYKPNLSLGNWVAAQRRFFKINSLSEDRVAHLNDIGFTWEVDNEDAWMAQYKELIKYKHEFGDCCVPKGYKANTSLAHWVQKQRKLFKSKILAEGRIAKLNEIGFTWEFDKEDAWMTIYKQLMEYKREFGDCCVPRGYKANPSLGGWVANQRWLFSRKSLPEDRIEKLKQIGFAWESKRNLYNPRNR